MGQDGRFGMPQKYQHDVQIQDGGQGEHVGQSANRWDTYENHPLNQVDDTGEGNNEDDEDDDDEGDGEGDEEADHRLSFEISDDEDDARAMALILGTASANGPPAYSGPSADPNIDPELVALSARQVRGAEVNRMMALQQSKTI